MDLRSRICNALRRYPTSASTPTSVPNPVKYLPLPLYTYTTLQYTYPCPYPCPWNNISPHYLIIPELIDLLITPALIPPLFAALLISPTHPFIIPNCNTIL